MAFCYAGKTFATALCGDLWTDGRPEEMNALNADVVLWPVWCDYTADEWNASARHEYAAQAALCGRNVLLVNPYCADPNAESRAAGAAARPGADSGVGARRHEAAHEHDQLDFPRARRP